MQLKGKLNTFGLTDDPAEGRKYLNVDINYGLLRSYFDKRVYDPFTGEGEQRVARDRHVSKLRSDISTGEYTPTAFNACVRSLEQINVEGRNVVVDLDENNKLVLLDGGSRMAALELLRQEGDVKLARKVDNLPIPIIIYLDPTLAKKDFLHLQLGLPVSRSQIQAMRIEQGHVNGEKYEYFLTSKKIAELLHKHDNSPIKDQVNFGHVVGGKFAFNALISDRVRDIAMSLFGTAKVLVAAEKDEQYFLEKWNWLINFAKANSSCTDEKKLLQLDGAKGCIHNWIGVTNIWMYYLYLREISHPTASDEEQLREAFRVYESDIAGDLSSARKCTLIGAFTQRLFSELVEDESMMTGFHCGIPLTLLVLMGKGTAFGVENPPNLSSRNKKNPPEQLVAEPVEKTTLDSDTDIEWDK